MDRPRLEGNRLENGGGEDQSQETCDHHLTDVSNIANTADWSLNFQFVSNSRDRGRCGFNFCSSSLIGRVRQMCAVIQRTSCEDRCVPVGVRCVPKGVRWVHMGVRTVPVRTGVSLGVYCVHMGVR